MISKNFLKFSLSKYEYAIKPLSRSFGHDPKQEGWVVNQDNQEKPKKSIYDLKVAEEYVTNNIKKFDWTTYVTANFLPSEVRQDYFNLTWFYYEMTRAVENTRESHLGMGKINFWRDSIEKVYDDSPIKEPVSICLHDTCKKQPIPKQLLMKLTDAKAYELNNPDCSDMLQFEQVCELNRTTLFHIYLRLLGIDTTDENVVKVAEHAGKCMGMLEYIKKIPYTLRKYRLFMPQDICDKHNVSVRTLWDRRLGKPKEELFDVVLEVAAHAKMHLEKARGYNDKLPPNAFRVFLPCAESEYFLQQLEKANFDIFTHTLHVPAYSTIPFKVFMNARKKQF